MAVIMHHASCIMHFYDPSRSGYERLPDNGDNSFFHDEPAHIYLGRQNLMKFKYSNRFVDECY
jgi:hypothetical protein